ncbi:MAG: ribosome maturation factor RimP [Sedimentibacter sp.]|uniref:ribosome maturation factor RimP n=1 Tax=Sedimentibacter sp. TaxID=1960295 RepID=UPI002981154D|nr:ribosome maturation factor RimP [Sedimentibacter sp.]MDW5300692.1 ribosome maturation factor RimP [Sedimentibacter sp.]
MSKKSIEAAVRKIVDDVIKSSEIELVDVEYVKEGPFKYLRIYIDKSEGITVDDCADVSRVLNKKLDEVDLIEEQYFLEVSSPGLERPFKTDADYQKNIGGLVNVNFYKPIDGKKSIEGILIEKQESIIVIKMGEENTTIELKDVSKINKVLEDF